MIIIIDAGKEFDKIQHPVKIKILAKWVQRDESWHNKCYLWQIHSQCNTQWQKTEILPTKIWNKTGCQLSTLFFNIVLEVLATAIKEEKEIRVIQTGREEVKLSLYAHGMTLYIQKPEDFTQKLLELIDEFSKVAGYKTYVQKSVAFLFTDNEISERECKKIPFKITLKNH